MRTNKTDPNTPTPETVRKATDFIRKVAKAPEGVYPERFIAIEWGSPLLQQITSGEKARLVEYLRDHGPVESVNELVHGLNRTKEAVSRDLAVLVKAGVVEAERNGRNKRLRVDRVVVIR